MGWRLPIVDCRLLIFIFMAIASAAAAQQAQVTAAADPARAVLGEPIHYRVTVESQGVQPDGQPVVSDWGGLNPAGSPSTSQNISTTLFGGSQKINYALSYEWTLTATQPGKYTIGSAQVTLGGNVQRTDPVTVEVVTSVPTANLPTDLQGEPIVSARTESSEINRQLEGRLFLRAIVSNKTPTIREPVFVTYLLYNDGLRLGMRFEPAVADMPGVLREELFSTNRLAFQQVQHNGKTYQVAKMYRAALTPTKPGKLTLTGYMMKLWLPVRRSQNDPFNDPFFSSMLDDTMFGGSVMATLPSPPLELDVKPLPEAGKPAGFTGTVGDFAISATADRTQLTTDDLITLRIALEGKGAIELADKPNFPKTADFQVVGQSVKATEKANTQDSIGGRKTFELVLRPQRAGDLAIPSILYPIYNPATSRFASLSTAAIPVKTVPGKYLREKAAPERTEGDENSAGSGMQQLRYLHAVGDLDARPPAPLVESLAFWSVQLAAACMMLGAWKRHRRLATQDPARKRRDGAWRAFERSLHSIRQSHSGTPTAELAGRMDHVARTYIADRFNLSADGLTRLDIERLLLERAVPETQVARLCDMLEGCEALRYAPVGAADGELGRWMSEIEDIFREHLRD